MLLPHMLLVGLAASSVAVLLWQRAHLIPAWVRLRREVRCLHMPITD